MPKKKWSIYPAVFLMSFAVILYEVALTRIYSVILAYHFVFMVISLALLGLGLGGVIAWYVLKRGGPGQSVSLPGLAAGYTLAVVASVGAILYVPASGRIEFYFAAALVPFLIAGVFFATVFQKWASLAGRIYFADLLGAAIGALAFLALINRHGGVNTVLAAAWPAILASVILMANERLSGRRRMWLVTAWLLPAFMIALTYTRYLDPRVPIGKDMDKDLYRIMQSPGANLQIIDSRWSSFGRTDLVQDRNDSLTMSIFIDGAAGAPMFRFNGDLSDTTNQSLRHLAHFSGFFPLLFLNEEQTDRALAIGSGGGRDVLLLLMAGVKDITAVEVNANAVDIVRQYADYNGGLYDGFPGVTVKTAEGRHFLRNSQGLYDVIFLSLPISKTAGAYNSFALNENTLFTTESLLDYYDHLTDEGQLIVVAHHMPEIYKLVFTAINALEKKGLAAPQVMKRILTTGPEMMPVFVLKKQPFSPELSDAIHRNVHAFGFLSETMYIPNVPQAFYRPLDDSSPFQNLAMMNTVLVALADGSIDLENVLKKAALDLRPPGDDRPFFYKMTLGLPAPLPLLFWLSAFLTGIVLSVPLRNIRRKTSDPNGMSVAHIPSVLLFALIGIGYIMIELVLFQRFTLYLGRPAVVLSILVAVLLLSSGLGSYVSSFFSKSLNRTIAISALVVAAAALLSLALLPILFQATVSWDFAGRLALAASVIFALGFFMGFPFPTAVRYLESNRMDSTIPWMWGVNGTASVLGAVVTVIIAIQYGYTWAMIGAALMYLAVFFLFISGPVMAPTFERR